MSDQINSLKNAAELSESNWTLILFLLFIDDMNAKDKAWSQFEHELIYENRFYSTHPIIQELHNKRDAAQSTLESGTILYRARIFDRGQFLHLASYYLDSTGASKEEIKSQLSEASVVCVGPKIRIWQHLPERGVSPSWLP